MFYFVKIPYLVQKLFPSYVWKMNSSKKEIFLTFDDGPHPVHTIFVLDELKKYNAKATFFCIGKNVQLYPQVYKRIIDDGHAIGNHTYNHIKGAKCSNDVYLKDIEDASKCIDAKLFRPPYGRIKNSQAKLIFKLKEGYKIIMWTVLSGDFDEAITKEKCLNNVLKNTIAGDIIVFHDSEKAAAKMKFALPQLLQKFNEIGFEFSKIAF